MSDKAQSVIEAELHQDEHLLWCGQPMQHKRFKGRPLKLPVIRFTLLWLGLGIFAVSLVLGLLGYLAPWVVPASALGLSPLALYCVLFGRSLLVAKVRAKTYYGVTDQRIIIVSDGDDLTRLVTSLDLRTLSQTLLAEGPGGIGNIVFGPAPPKMPLPGATHHSGLHVPPRFDLIEDVRKVYNQIIDAQRAADVNMTPA